MPLENNPSPQELEQQSHSAHLQGREDERVELLTRAHQAYLEQGQPEPAVRIAVWVAFIHEFRRDHALANGWHARARRLLEECGTDCVEQGYLQLPTAIRYLFDGDPASASTAFATATEVGERFRDLDLIGIGRNGQGRALIRLGQRAEGIALLDEVMVSVTSGEISQVMVGDLYCSLIEGCHELYDMRRAQQWTDALSRWCESQPEITGFRVACLVHRAEMLQLHGDWPLALQETRVACQRTRPASGAAYYQLGELLRLKGEYLEAEDAYRTAAERGRNPEPGLALLRLAQGRIEAASRAIRRAVEEARDPRSRARLLGAYVEILLEEGDLAPAEEAAGELLRIAAEFDAPLLHAVANHAAGAVLLARSDGRSALEALRKSSDRWREVAAPYDAARTNLLIANAFEFLGDRDAAAMELDAARRCFERLGAQHELSRLRGVRGTSSDRLTTREIEVVRLIATGSTNRAIATKLGISEKTVARHVSNVFTKLGLSSRAAATAYAYQHHLVGPST